MLPSSFNTAEINLAALKSNFLAVKRLVSGQLMAVVKGDAYGHGLVECAKALSSVQASRLGVLDLEEATALKKAGVPAEIHILAGLHGTEQIDQAVQSGFVVTAYRVEQIAELSKAAQRTGRTALLMIKIDTGMGRLGIPWKEAAEAIPKLSRLDGLDVRGLATHLATSGDYEAQWQLKRFADLKDLANRSFTGRLLHSALASGGVLAHPDYPDDLSRVGIMLYGSSPLSEKDPAIFDLPASKNLIRSLQPVMSLKSRILAVRTFKSGETVSYDRTFTVQRDTAVATVPAGYVHGLSRTRSGKGWALVGGRKARLLGRVCMNLSMYDVTGAAVLPGQETVLLGAQGSEAITAETVGEWQGTNSYEILCMTGRLNPRRYVEP
jgi:alanine racemase